MLMMNDSNFSNETTQVELPIGSGAVDLEEADLVRRLKANEPNAFETVVRVHGPRMLAVAARFLPCEQDRDDAVQDAFISAFKAISKFDGDSKLATWLHRITVNCCLMKLRTRSRRPEAAIEELLPCFDETGHHVGGVRAWEGNSLEQLMTDETCAQVRQCIDQLPDSYRVVLLMRDIDGLDTEQTAKMLKCTQANVKTRLHRARQALRTLLAPTFAPN